MCWGCYGGSRGSGCSHITGPSCFVLVSMTLRCTAVEADGTQGLTAGDTPQRRQQELESAFAGDDKKRAAGHYLVCCAQNPPTPPSLSLALTLHYTHAHSRSHATVQGDEIGIEQADGVRKQQVPGPDRVRDEEGLGCIGAPQRVQHLQHEDDGAHAAHKGQQDHQNDLNKCGGMMTRYKHMQGVMHGATTRGAEPLWICYVMPCHHAVASISFLQLLALNEPFFF